MEKKNEVAVGFYCLSQLFVDVNTGSINDIAWSEYNRIVQKNCKMTENDL